jgi:hypothetical protein
LPLAGSAGEHADLSFTLALGTGADSREDTGGFSASTTAVAPETGLEVGRGNYPTPPTSTTGLHGIYSDLLGTTFAGFLCGHLQLEAEISASRGMCLRAKSRNTEKVKKFGSKGPKYVISALEPSVPSFS